MSEDDIGAKVNIGQIVSGKIFSEETLEEIEVTNCSLSDKIPLDDPKVNKYYNTTDYNTTRYFLLKLFNETDFFIFGKKQILFQTLKC